MAENLRKGKRFAADSAEIELPNLRKGPSRDRHACASLGNCGKEPILRFVDWYESEILGRSLNEAAHAGAKTYLFFDEVQNLPGWAPQLKFLVDHSTTQVVVTGSSALRIEQGRDSLAGRLTTIDAGVLSLTEIGLLRGLPLGQPFLPDNGLEPLLHRDFWRDLRAHGQALGAARDTAFAAFAERGGYPLMHARPDASWAEMADQLNENLIRRVIQHDLRVGDRGRKRDPALLEELFRLCCRYAGQAPRIGVLTEALQRSMGADVGVARVRQYLRFLAEYQRRLDPVRDTAGLRAFLAKPANRAPFGLLVTRSDDDLDYGEPIALCRCRRFCCCADGRKILVQPPAARSAAPASSTKPPTAPQPCGPPRSSRPRTGPPTS